jgi:hypothetical protein
MSVEQQRDTQTNTPRSVSLRRVVPVVSRTTRGRRNPEQCAAPLLLLFYVYIRICFFPLFFSLLFYINPLRTHVHAVYASPLRLWTQRRPWTRARGPVSFCLVSVIESGWVTTLSAPENRFPRQSYRSVRVNVLWARTSVCAPEIQFFFLLWNPN